MVGSKEEMTACATTGKQLVVVAGFRVDVELHVGCTEEQVGGWMGGTIVEDLGDACVRGGCRMRLFAGEGTEGHV